MRTIVYPGALHGFDQPTGEVRYLPRVYNPGAPGGRGAHVGPQPKARQEAIDDIEGFVKQVLKP